VDLTPVQRRTLEQLIDREPATRLPDGFDAVLRERIETAVRETGLAGDLTLSKSKLNTLDHCEGAFAADLAGESEPFVHRPATMVGNLVHKAVELDVGGREDVPPRSLAERAAVRLGDEAAFGGAWRGITPEEQDEVLAEAVRQIELFVATFPPLRPLRDRLRPVAEMSVRTELAGGGLLLAGRVDLALSPPSGRVLLDLKTQDAWPEHAEDMRFYALLAILRFGVAPSRVATVYLASGSWQPEDVDESSLDRAVERVVHGIGAAARARDGASPALTPGPHCSWCPRRATCPVSAAVPAS
jgi:RecB family exonuclease